MFKWIKKLWHRGVPVPAPALPHRPFLDGPPLSVRPASVADLAAPEVIDLFLSAKWFHLDPLDPLVEMLEQLQTPDPPIVLLGFQGSTPKALAIILPPRRLSGDPQVFHFYNGGPRALRALLARNVVAHLRSAGYTRALAFATRGGPAWEKIFAVAKPKKTGDVYTLEIGEH